MPVIETESRTAPKKVFLSWQTASLVLRLLVGLSLLLFTFWQVNLTEVWQLFKSVNLTWILLAILSILISTALKLFRWDWLLRQFQVYPGLQRAAGGFFLGQAANIVLPIRGGELVRLGWISAARPAKTPEIIASILLEKYLDLIALIVLVTGLGESQLLGSNWWRFPVIICLTVLLLGLVWGAAPLWERLKPWIKARVEGHLPPRLRPWLTKLDELVESSRWLRKPEQFIFAIGLTGLTWIVMWSTNLLVMKGLALPADSHAAALTLALIYIGLVPALMPGNLGPFYFFSMIGLSAVTSDVSQRAAFGVLLHALVTIPPLILAGIYLLLKKFR